MKHLPLLLALIALLTSCVTSRRAHTVTDVTTDSLAIQTRRDYTYITVHDTIELRDQVHLVVRDTTITREHIVIQYDIETGRPLSRTEDRDIIQTRTLDSLARRIQQLQHSLDSLTLAEQSSTVSITVDSLSVNDTLERGDAARSGWQSFLHTLRQYAWIAIILLLLYAGWRLYRRFFL